MMLTLLTPNRSNFFKEIHKIKSFTPKIETRFVAMSSAAVTAAVAGGLPHEAWVPMTLPIALEDDRRSSARKLSAANKYKSWNRPKSTPSALRSAPSGGGSFNTDGAPDNRPKTALGTTRADCDRVSQLEHEPTRKHNLESHLPLRKTKPTPWQKQLDGPTVRYVSTPTYTISRNRSKVSMTIKTGDFFEPEPEEKIVKKVTPERDSLISQLQTQIDDLTLFLEEERLNHRETKRKAADLLRDKLTELNNVHDNQIKVTKQQHEEELSKMREDHEQEMSMQAAASQATIAELRGEVEFFQGAFESYKSKLVLELDEKWLRKEAEMGQQHQDEMLKKLHELRTRIVSEKNSEKSDLERDHQRDLQNLRREHKRVVDSMTRRFSSAAADMERLKEIEVKLKETEDELMELRTNYNNVCKQLADVTRDLTDSKVRLMSYEHHFQDKVDEVDNKYKAQMDELRMSNAQLRRLYMKKCGELSEEKVISDTVHTQKLDSAKKTMKNTDDRGYSIRHQLTTEKLRNSSAKTKPPSTAWKPSSQKPSSSRKPLSKRHKGDYVYMNVTKSYPRLGVEVRLAHAPSSHTTQILNACLPPAFHSAPVHSTNVQTQNTFSQSTQSARSNDAQSQNKHSKVHSLHTLHTQQQATRSLSSITRTHSSFPSQTPIRHSPPQTVGPWRALESKTSSTTRPNVTFHSQTEADVSSQTQVVMSTLSQGQRANGHSTKGGSSSLAEEIIEGDSDVVTQSKASCCDVISESDNSVGSQTRPQSCDVIRIPSAQDFERSSEDDDDDNVEEFDSDQCDMFLETLSKRYEVSNKEQNKTEFPSGGSPDGGAQTELVRSTTSNTLPERTDTLPKRTDTLPERIDTLPGGIDTLSGGIDTLSLAELEVWEEIEWRLRINGVVDGVESINCGKDGVNKGLYRETEPVLGERGGRRSPPGGIRGAGPGGECGRGAGAAGGSAQRATGQRPSHPGGGCRSRHHRLHHPLSRRRLRAHYQKERLPREHLRAVCSRRQQHSPEQPPRPASS